VRVVDGSLSLHAGEGRDLLVKFELFDQGPPMVALRTQMNVAAQPTRFASGGRGLRVFG
jgi:hypothetical protein